MAHQLNEPKYPMKRAEQIKKERRKYYRLKEEREKNMALDLNYELKKVDDSHYAVEMSISEMALNNYVYKLEEKLNAELLNRCERTLNNHGWFKERTCKLDFNNSYYGICECGYGVYFDMNYCPKCGAKVVK